MDTEAVAAAAVYLMSSYNYFLHVCHYLHHDQRRRTIRKKWRKRRLWMSSVHRNRTRESMEKQLAELLQEPSGGFSNLRMSGTDFEFLLQKISPMIKKNDTGFRESIPSKIRLAVTLRFLATGESYKSLHLLFKISSQVISRIIPEVCLALNEVLNDVIKIPTTAEEWLTKTEGFDFPHCVGAIDGRHVKILCQPNVNPEYFSYKGGFSVTLLALVDSDHCFMFADVGSQGRVSDCEVFHRTELWQKISDKTLNLPNPSRIGDSTANYLYTFIANKAFELDNNIMTPYPGDHNVGSKEEIFNRQLTNSLTVVDNAFGIMTSVFGVFGKPIALSVENASTVIMTCVLLHNFLRKSTTSRDAYCPEGTTDTWVNGELVRSGSWRRDKVCFFPLRSVSHGATDSARQIRLSFANYVYQNKEI